MAVNNKLAYFRPSIPTSHAHRDSGPFLTAVAMWRLGVTKVGAKVASSQGTDDAKVLLARMGSIIRLAVCMCRFLAGRVLVCAFLGWGLLQTSLKAKQNLKPTS